MKSDHRSSARPHEHWLNKGDLLTVEEAADILRVSPKTVREWLRKGKLVSLKFGKQWRIRRQDLESFALQAVRAAQLQNLQPLPPEDQAGTPDKPSLEA
jgi:excisionase family DNA binding protein